MSLTIEAKREIIQKHGKSETDTGSPEVQIALLSARISHLTLAQRHLAIVITSVSRRQCPA